MKTAAILPRWLRLASMLLVSRAPVGALAQTVWPLSPFNVNIATASSTPLVAGGSAATSLAAYNVGPSTVTVAGISSGGYMAVQLQVAYSQSIFGTAVFAGGPYYCAQGSVVSALGYCDSGSGIPLQTLVDYTNAQAANGKIDPTSHIALGEQHLPICWWPNPLSTLLQRFACARLSRPCLPKSCPGVSATLTTSASFPQRLAVA